LRARHEAPRTALELVVNFALPALIYKGAKASLGDVEALMAATAPPIAWAIVALARERRIDALSVLSLAGISLSLLAFAGGGGARLLQLREQLVAVVIGLVFLGSAAIGRPLIYHLARARIRRRSVVEAQSFEAMRENSAFRRAMMRMTLAWGATLIAEASLAVLLLFVLTIQQYLLVNPVIGYLTLAALTAWTFWYARRAIESLRREKRPQPGDRVGRDAQAREAGELSGGGPAGGKMRHEDLVR
jgi:hypothetical protein